MKNIETFEKCPKCSPDMILLLVPKGIKVICKKCGKTYTKSYDPKNTMRI